MEDTSLLLNTREKRKENILQGLDDLEQIRQRWDISNNAQVEVFEISGVGQKREEARTIHS